MSMNDYTQFNKGKGDYITTNKSQDNINFITTINETNPYYKELDNAKTAKKSDDIEELKTYKESNSKNDAEQLEIDKCPICSSISEKIEINGIPLKLCNKCGLIYGRNIYGK